MNEPCAPGYDPETGTYHLFYQCRRIREAAIIYITIATNCP